MYIENPVSGNINDYSLLCMILPFFKDAAVIIGC